MSSTPSRIHERRQVSPGSAPRASAERVASLDVLRGLMALSVALYHMSVWTPVFAQGKPVSNAVAVLGVYSVQGFFVLSGFCFFLLYRGRDLAGRELLSFHVKRFFRIAPLYYLALALNFALDQHFGPSFTWERLAGNLSLTFGLVHPNYAMVLGGWSIGLEYVFYMAFPLLLLLSRQVLARYALTAVLLGLAYPYTFGKVQAAEPADTFHTYVQIPNHAFLFMLGAVLADLRSYVRVRLPAFALPLAVCAALAGLYLQNTQVYDHRDLMVGLVRVQYLAGCFLLMVVFALCDLPERVWLGVPAWLGQLSYSVYLLHPFAWLLMKALLPGLSPSASVAVGLVLTVALAALVFRVLEQPALRLGQRLAAHVGGAKRARPALGEGQTQAT